MAPPMYKYLCGADLSTIKVVLEDVPNYDVQTLLKRVRSCLHSSVCVLTLPSLSFMTPHADSIYFQVEEASDARSVFGGSRLDIGSRLH